jgi:DNA-binding NtrC family response regulator
MRRSSFRLVAATNRDPSSLKHDFAARFTSTVAVPSLEERREDIPLLARALVRRAAKRSPEVAGRFVTVNGVRISAGLVVHLLTRTYTTNARELDAILWKSLAESPGDILELPPSLRAPRGLPASDPNPSSSSSDAASDSGQGAARPSRPDPSADEVRAALTRAGGSVPRAARELGLSSRYALYRLMRKHGIAGARDDDEPGSDPT